MNDRIAAASYKSLAVDQDRSNVTELKILSFRGFPVGWHYGEGVPFDNRVIQRANAWNRAAQALNFGRTGAFPGLSGEIVVTVYWRNEYLETSFEPDGTVTVSRERNSIVIYEEEGLTEYEARGKLVEFRDDTWNSSVSSIKSIFGTQRYEDSRVLPFVAQVAT